MKRSSNRRCDLQLWRHAISLMADVILEGISSVRSRCSAIGRNTMSSDVQVPLKSISVQHHAIFVAT